MPDLIQLNLAANKAALPVINQVQQVYLLLELNPGDEKDKTRLPLNFVLLLDQSGSMAGEKLRTMKAAVQNLIDQLAPDDIISIVAFDSDVHVIAPAAQVTDRWALKREVEGIQEGGRTSLAAALQEALKQVMRFADSRRVSRIVLLTDGDPTDGPDNSRYAADLCAERHIPLICLGFGKDWKEDFLIDLADRSTGSQPGSRSGHVEFIQSPEKALSIFQQVYQSMQVVARGVRLNISLVQGMEARRVWSAVPEIRDISAGAIQGRQLEINIGDMEKAGVSYLLELLVPPRPAGNVRLARVEAICQGADGQEARVSQDLILNFTQDPKAAAQLNGRVMNLVERIQAFKLQTVALNELNSGDAGRATIRLRQAATILLGQGEQELSRQLNDEADRLERGEGLSSDGLKTIKLTGSKTRRLTD